MPAAKTGLPVLQASWHPALGIRISGEKLPPLSAGRTLQLGLIAKAASAKPIPSPTFRPASDGKFRLFVETAPDREPAIMALASSEEPEGSRQPTNLGRNVAGK
jgi:hypothetical protein